MHHGCRNVRMLIKSLVPPHQFSASLIQHWHSGFVVSPLQLITEKSVSTRLWLVTCPILDGRPGKFEGLYWKCWQLLTWVCESLAAAVSLSSSWPPARQASSSAKLQKKLQEEKYLNISSKGREGGRGARGGEWGRGGEDRERRGREREDERVRAWEREKESERENERIELC